MNKVSTANPKVGLSIDTARQLVDESLSDFFASNIASAYAIDPQYAKLWESIQILMQAGGKRIRSYMTLLSYEAFGGTDVTSIIPIAAAQELLHASLLIHDDIIDRDYIRYGVDNVSGQYDKLYASFISDNTERRHFSDSAAILAGDLLLSGGYQLLRSAPISAASHDVAAHIFGQAIFTVAGGELLDTESAFRHFDDVDSIAIAKHKTAHYSFVTPLVMGASLAGASASSVTKLRSLGEDVGIAYQLVDDLLGVFGDEEQTGKSNVTDIEEGKHTYLIEQFKSMASHDEQERVRRILGKKSITPAEAQEFRHVLTTSGAKAHTEQAVEAYTSRALETLASIEELSSDARESFASLIERSTRRDR